MGVTRDQGEIRKKAVAVVPICTFIMGACGFAILISDTRNDSFQGWVFFGLFAGFFLSLGMFVAYFFLFRLSHRFPRQRVALACTTGGMVIFIWLVFLNIQATQALPSRSTTAQTVVYSVLTLINVMDLLWFLLVLKIALGPRANDLGSENDVSAGSSGIQS